MTLSNLINLCVKAGERTYFSQYCWVFQLSGEPERLESWLLGNECGSLRGLCDRWRGWLGETGCWWSGQLCLTVACCFSALSFASSSCFCKAACRDFISSLSSEREVRNAVSTSCSRSQRSPLLCHRMSLLNIPLLRTILHTSENC